MIKIDRERYLKQTFTDLETLNEPSSTYFLVLGNYFCDFDFGNFFALSYDIPLTQNYEISFQENFLMMVGETLFYQELVLEITEQIGGKEESGIKKEVDSCRSKIWTLYFDGSKSKEGSGAWSILIDPKVKRNFLSYRL
jgi:hypothetical protein